jgi:hypothetical protein
MTRIDAQRMGNNVLIPQQDLERLVQLAQQHEEIELHVHDDDTPTYEIMRLIEQGGSFDFWMEEGEDIYSAEDGEPV